MTREEKLRQLFVETQEGLEEEGLSLEEIEEALVIYYQAAGFEIETIDELLEAGEDLLEV